ncbi:MAG: ATP-binding protein [Planctomycetota bacterium]
MADELRLSAHPVIPFSRPPRSVDDRLGRNVRSGMDDDRGVKSPGDRRWTRGRPSSARRSIWIATAAAGLGALLLLLVVADLGAVASRSVAATGLGALVVLLSLVWRMRRGHEDEAVLSNILEIIPYAVFWKDRASRYLGCNRVFAGLAGLDSPEAIVGQDDYSMPWTPAETEAYRADDRAVMESGEPKLHIVEPQRTAAGDDIWLDTSKVPLRDPAGKVCGVLGVFSDITTLKRIQRDLETAKTRAEAANRAKTEFLANMSHEIRTPLTAILGYTELLAESESDMDPQARAETARTILRAGEHLLTVVNDVLDISKIEAGRMEVEDVETDLHELLLGVDDLLQPRAQGKGLTLRWQVLQPIPRKGRIDPTRLRQILINLLGNALKFTDHGGVTVRLGCEPEGDGHRLWFDVEDTGPGLSQEQRGSLFRPFSQADGSVTRKFGGSGLGLTISRRLAGLLGGDVRLLSSEPGVGSTFRAEVRALVPPGTAFTEEFARPVACPSATEGPATQLSGRVLLAEDGPDNQRLIAFFLTRAGARVDVAENGLIALTMIDNAERTGEPYGLLVSDMQMPEMDGYTLVETLRSRSSELAVIALTAHAMSEDQSKCLASGCDDYATKPIDRAKLIATCAHWLGRRSTFLRRPALSASHVTVG